MSLPAIGAGPGSQYESLNLIMPQPSADSKSPWPCSHDQRLGGHELGGHGSKVRLRLAPWAQPELKPAGHMHMHAGLSKVYLG